MAFRNQQSVSEVQLSLELKEEVMTQELDNTDCTDDDQFLNLLEQILVEAFVHEAPEDSLESIEGNFIYNLDTEKDIEFRERSDHEWLNDGHPEVDQFDDLEALAKVYFQNPRVYPLDEDDFRPNHCTGFLQIYSGEKFDSRGQMKEVWKSLDRKILVRISDLMDPERVISIIEASGIKWGSIFRVIFYGSPLVEIIGSRFYSQKESRELLPLTDQHPNILLALPDYEETDAFSESIYDWMDREFEEGILYGIQPNVSRVTIGHHELTEIRLQEVFEEELEERNLFRILKKETLSVAKRNQFIETYQEARSLIKEVNVESKVDRLYSLELKILEDILFLCSRGFERINDSLVYAQVKSLATKKKVSNLQVTDSKALMLIQKINAGDLVEAHLLSLSDLEGIFGILYSNIGIRIENKEVYYDLKERLRVLRAKFRTSKKGKAG